jgi:hypothetical protein
MAMADTDIPTPIDIKYTDIVKVLCPRGYAAYVKHNLGIPDSVPIEEDLALEVTRDSIIIPAKVIVSPPLNYIQINYTMAE